MTKIARKQGQEKYRKIEEKKEKKMTKKSAKTEK